MKKLDSVVADDLLSRINPSLRPDKLSTAMGKCPYGSKQAERTILNGLRLLAKGQRNEVSQNKQ